MPNYSKDGYHCVPTDMCNIASFVNETFIDPSDISYAAKDAICQEKAFPTTCCHKNDIKECTEFNNDGFQCVNQESCSQESPFGPRSAEPDDVSWPGYAYCPIEGTWPMSSLFTFLKNKQLFVYFFE